MSYIQESHDKKWVTYLDPEDSSPSIIASMERDEFIFEGYRGDSKGFIRYYRYGRIGRKILASYLPIEELVARHLAGLSNPRI